MFRLYDDLKFMLGIQILIRMDPDLFGQIRIPERAVAALSFRFAVKLESLQKQVCRA
jgi:hypothetical protein